MDAITLLKNDHRTVEQLFKRFEKAGQRAHAQKRQIVDRIIEELSVHAAIEEQIFYPAARAAVPDAEDLALEALEEHHLVKWSLSELEDMDPEHERFDAKVTVLIEHVRHHVTEEEGDFFPKVREQLGRNELAEWGDAMAEAKKSAPTRPHPRMPAKVVTGAISGVVGRVGDNVSGVVQGGVSAVQDLTARVTGSERPKASPTGSSTARQRAKKVRTAAATANDGVAETARNARSGASSTAKAAKSGVKGTATSARKVARSTATTAKRATTTTGRTASTAATTTANAAKRHASKTGRARTNANATSATRTASTSAKTSANGAKTAVKKPARAKPTTKGSGDATRRAASTATKKTGTTTKRTAAAAAAATSGSR
jgi:hemerythrin superfamily protein